MGLKDKEKFEEALMYALKNSRNVRELIVQIREEQSAVSVSPQTVSADTSRAEELKRQLDKANETIRRQEAEIKKNEQQIAKLNRDLETAKFEAQSLRNKHSELKDLVYRLVSEKQSLSDQLSAEKETAEKLEEAVKKLEKTVGELKKKFEIPVKYSAMYKSLSDSVRDGLSNVICDENEILFIASGTSSDSLKAIWNYTRDIISDNCSRNDAEILKTIFDYFFEIYNDSLPERIYERDDTEIGDYLDNDIHDRASGSSTSGEITQVILRGYKSVNTGNMICRSLVKV